MDRVNTQITIGLATALVLVGGLATWATTVPLAGAVVAAGTVVVDGNIKKIQHPTGGVIARIGVKEGDRVEKDDLLIRLDDTVTRASLGIVRGQLNAVVARQARLMAERDGRAALATPDSVPMTAELRDMLAGEEAVFVSRQSAREGQKAQLRERIAQLREEIRGLAAQRVAKEREQELVSRELGEAQKLWAKNLLPLARLITLQRDAARIDGEQAQLQAAEARARARITETELQIIQVDQELQTEVAKELRELQTREAELAERRVAAEDQLRRIDVRAPLAGVIHQLGVHTIGGVVTAGEALMMVVPDETALIVEARIAPQDIEQVRIGKTASLRFVAFAARTTPEVRGRVVHVSADLTRDPATGQHYYLCRVAFEQSEREAVNSLKLLPGMPAEVHVKTADLTALAYLTKPLADQMAKAFVER
jgi:HlyD family secretion protein